MADELERPDNEQPETPANSLWPWLAGLAIVLLILLAAAGSILVNGYVTIGGTPTPTIPPPTPTPMPTLPPPTPITGWSPHPKQGFQITLPNSWQEIPLDDAQLQQQIDSASTNNPHLADQLRGILSSGQNRNFVLYALDSQSAGSAVTNVSVARTTIPAGTTVSQAAQDFANSLPQLLKGAKAIGTRGPLEINGLPASEVDYDLALVNSEGQLVNLRGIMFLIGGKGEAGYVVTVTGEASKSPEWTPLARLIGSTFWLPGS